MLAPLFNIPNYFPDAFLLCVPTHLYVYRPYHIPHLFREISRATTCDLKSLVTPLAGEKLTGMKCTILGKEHLAPRPFQGAFQVASCSMLCSPWNLNQCVACILWLWNHVLLVFWRAPFVTHPHVYWDFPVIPPFPVIQWSHRGAHCFSSHHLLTVSGTVRAQLLLKKEVFCLLFSSIL